MSAKWRREVKGRLRQLARDAGSQVKLSKKLRNGGKASQISRWCNDDLAVLPDALHLAQLRERCGASIDWLLCGAPPHETEDEAWPPERRAKLADELETLAVRVMGDYIDEISRFGGHVMATRMLASSHAFRGLDGNALEFVERKLRELVNDQAGWVFREEDFKDAARFRRQQRGKFRSTAAVRRKGAS